MKKINLALIPIIILFSLIPASIFAVSLPPNFDEPCPMGQSIIQEVCFAVNILHDEIHLLIDRVTSLEISLSIVENDISVLKGNVTSLDTKLSDHETLINAIQALANNIQTFANNTQIALDAETPKLSILTDRYNTLESQGDISYQGFQTIDARFTAGGFFVESGLQDMYVPAYVDGTAVIRMQGELVVQEFRTYEIQLILNGNIMKTCVLTSLQPVECESDPFTIIKFDQMQIFYKKTGGLTDVSYKMDLDAYVKMTEFP